MKTLVDLVLEYRDSAVSHHEGIVGGNSKLANESHERLVELGPAIRGFGKDGEVALALLAEDPEDAIAYAAATHLLKIDEPKAVGVLSRIAEKKGIVAFSAFMVLKQWRKGGLTLP